MTRGHSASGMTTFSRTSTGVVWTLSPITTMLLASFVCLSPAEVLSCSRAERLEEGKGETALGVTDQHSK
ncbi:hypothetical protein U1Q18_043332, partial [Sarracenia purpurea var. burkii]